MHPNPRKTSMEKDEGAEFGHSHSSQTQSHTLRDEADINNENGSLFRINKNQTPSSEPSRETPHRSSLLNDTAREALIGPYRNQTAVLLTVASSGAFIFLIINLVGVLLCKGYFRKRAPNHPAPNLYLHSLSQSRRNRYSTLLRRFSLESYPHSCCEYPQQGAITLPCSKAPHYDRHSEGRWMDLSPCHIVSEDGSTNRERPHVCAPLVNGLQMAVFVSDLELPKRNKANRAARMKNEKRSRSFDESLFLRTSRRSNTKGQRLLKFGPTQMTNC